MSGLPLTVAIRNHDHLAPLACGDVVPEGIDLDLRRGPYALSQTLSDPQVLGGELSFSRHLVRLDQGDRSFVGMPILIMRAFRQRCIWVRRGSGLTRIEDLAGKRIGTNEWPATGIVWTRALLPEAGVRIEGIDWWAGQIDDETPICLHGPLPPHAREAPPDRMLRDMLLEGQLDALMCPHPPKGFREPNSPIVRLIQDYRPVEQAYYRRTGLFPPHHIIGLRQEVFARNPWVLRSLYLALDQSMRLWHARRREMDDTSPWLLADLEAATELMGDDWWPNGIEPNRKVIQTLCDESLVEGLIEQPLDPETVFAEFLEVMGGIRP